MTENKENIEYLNNETESLKNLGEKSSGVFKGELLGNILDKLPDYKFHTIAVDINGEALKENLSAQEKIISTLDKIPLKDKSIDVVFCRYVLAWNNPKKQQEILKEITRIVSGFAII